MPPVIIRLRFHGPGNASRDPVEVSDAPKRFLFDSILFDYIRQNWTDLSLSVQPTIDVVNGSYLRFAVIRNIMILFNFYGFTFWIIFI